MPKEKSKILVVDDNIDFCDIISEYINMQPDMKIDGVAYDGNIAIELILEKQPDVVLLDYNLPKMNGLSVLVHIKKNPSLSKIKFIAISADNTQLIKMLDQGAECFIVKPTGFEEIIRKIRSLI